MSILSQPIWTYELNAGTFIITPANGFTVISLTLVSGTGYYQGTATSNGVASVPVNLVIGQSVTISTSGINVLGEFSITTTGVVSIIGKQ
jgi:hypothetical protein